jgi:hypothetical protein
VLFDPSLQVLPDGIREGNVLDIDIGTVGELVAQSEIDFRTLKANIRSVLEISSQVSVGEVLEQHPAAQGLGSVVGLVALGSKYGLKSENTETVSWTGNDDQKRSAKIPKIFFLRERIDELA